jgi:hypothetical protein
MLSIDCVLNSQPGVWTFERLEMCTFEVEGVYSTSTGVWTFELVRRTQNCNNLRLRCHI